MSKHNLGGMSTSTKYSQDQIRGWVEQFKAGKSYRKIADDEKVPYPTVFWHMRKLGLTGHRSPGRKKVHVGRTEAEVARMWKLQKNYGITIEQYDAMLEAQGGVCAICKRPPKGGNTSSKNLNVDHDHKTGERRGLLCNDCNPALGKFQDSPQLLRAAAAYLENHV
jgi:hypothetical protein